MYSVASDLNLLYVLLYISSQRENSHKIRMPMIWPGQYRQIKLLVVVNTGGAKKAICLLKNKSASQIFSDISVFISVYEKPRFIGEQKFWKRNKRGV